MGIWTSIWIAVEFIKHQEQDYCQKDQSDCSAEGEVGDVILIGCLGCDQIGDFVKHQGGADAEGRWGEELQLAIARAEGEDEGCGDCDEDSEEQMMDEVASGVDVLHVHEVEIEPQAGEGEEHWEQD